jgi:5-carboxymethyl-2-hydroxymuconate isomerase
MPHLILEHSANVSDVAEIAGLVVMLHHAALATGIAPLDALRTRAAQRDIYAVGDEYPKNGFIAVTARLAPGRSDSDKQILTEALMAALSDALGDAQDNLMLSVEYQEIDPLFRINKNNLRSVIAERNIRHEGTRRGC